MTQTAVFRTSHKPLSYYCDTPETQALMGKFGSHLQQLNQEEKFQLMTATCMYLWALSSAAEDCEEDDGMEVDSLSTLFNNQCSEPLSPDVSHVLALLDDSEPDALAAMLPAIGFYAAEDASR